MLRNLECFAIARRPRLSSFQRGAFRFPDRDHLFRVRTCELTSAGKTAAAPDLGEILTYSLFSFSHTTLNMHRKRLTMQAKNGIRSASVCLAALILRHLRSAPMPTACRRNDTIHAQILDHLPVVS
jgi:hypothetical protein